MYFNQCCFLFLFLVSTLLFAETSFCEEPQKKPLRLSQATHSACLKILRQAIEQATEPEDTKFWPAIHAAEALTLAGHGGEVRKTLEPLLKREKNDQHRCGLARELVRAGDRSQVKIMLDILTTKNSNGHVHACESLYKVNEIGDGRAMRQAMQQTQNGTKALMAAAAFARQGDAAAFKLLRKQLTSEDADLRRIAAWVLGRVGESKDIPALSTAKSKTEDLVHRSYFVNAMARLGDLKAQQNLLKNLSSNDAKIRTYAAVFASEANLFSAQTQLEKMLNAKEVDVRVRAAQSLLVLSRPITSKPKVTLILPPSKQNPRNSEGDFIRLKDGRLMFIYSHFFGGSADHASARLNARFSDDQGKTWSTTEQVVVKNEGGFNVMSVSLLRLQNGKIALFYLRKNSLHDCRPMMRMSTDEGKTWSDPKDCMTEQTGYFVMNNDRAIQLKSGRLILPFSKHHYETRTKTWDWNGQVIMSLSDDSGKTWRQNKHPLIGTDASGKRLYTQEPGLVQLKDGRVMLFVRSNAGSQLLASSKDEGETFSKLMSSNIISPVSPASIKRIPMTGDLLMVWNNHKNIKPTLRGKRTPLSIAISKDDGKTWQKTKNLRNHPTGWYCYTAIHFEGKHILLGHCAGDRTKNNGLAETNITRLSIDWLYQ